MANILPVFRWKYDDGLWSERTDEDTMGKEQVEGWESLLAVAQAAGRTDAPAEAIMELVVSIGVRVRDRVPPEHLGEVVAAVVAASVRAFPLYWPSEVRDWLVVHLGNEGVAQALEGTGCGLVTCKKCKFGPHIQCLHPDPALLFMVLTACGTVHIPVSIHPCSDGDVAQRPHSYSVH